MKVGLLWIRTRYKRIHDREPKQGSKTERKFKLSRQVSTRQTSIGQSSQYWPNMTVLYCQVSQAYIDQHKSVRPKLARLDNKNQSD